MQVTPYLFLEGRCEEALAFYAATLDAKVTTLMRFADAPVAGMPTPGEKVMHAAFTVGDSAVMASDGSASGAPTFAGFSLSLTCATPAEAERRFAALADGGEVRQPMAATFFAPAFGVVRDRFGVSWLIMANPGSGA